MSSEMQHWSSNVPVTRGDRQVSRMVSRKLNGALLRMTDVDVEAEVAETKVRSYTSVTAVAMGEVARLGQLEKALVLSQPELSGRLGYFGDGHAIELVGLLSQFGGRLRRL